MGLHRRLPLYLMLFISVLAGAHEVIHTMQAGETLFTLARRYGLTVQQIEVFNAIDDPNAIPIGAEIRIPGTYVVERGEYPYSIAQKLDVSWLELLEANGLSRDDIVRPGDVLLVPSGAAPHVDVAEPAVPEPETVIVASEEVAAESDTGQWVPRGDIRWPHPGARSTVDGKFPGTAMAGQIGDPFFSVSDGIVEYVAPYSAYGRSVLVRGANGYTYGYFGAGRVDVVTGERIESGTQLGTLGASSIFQEPSILFTVYRDYRPVDPATAPR